MYPQKGIYYSTNTCKSKMASNKWILLENFDITDILYFNIKRQENKLI